jgi:hypothetical protein
MSASIVLEVLQHCKLHGAQRAVLSTLAAYVDTYGPHVFPSLDTLARSADISERHLQRCLRALEQQGYLDIIRRKEPGKNARNFYQVLFPWRVPAQKSTDTFADLPAQKSTDIKCPSKDLKTQEGVLRSKKGEKRAESTDMPRQIAADLHNDPSYLDHVHRFLTPGSQAFWAAMGASQLDPSPATALPHADGIFFYQGQKYRFEAKRRPYPPAAVAGL